MTYVGQKFCMVVYPAVSDSSSSGSGEEGEEMKEARAPLSKEDRDNRKSADCWSATFHISPAHQTYADTHVGAHAHTWKHTSIHVPPRLVFYLMSNWVVWPQTFLSGVHQKCNKQRLAPSISSSSSSPCPLFNFNPINSRCKSNFFYTFFYFYHKTDCDDFNAFFGS